jgi:hypothetical protein
LEEQITHGSDVATGACEGGDLAAEATGTDGVEAATGVAGWD